MCRPSLLCMAAAAVLLGRRVGAVAVAIAPSQQLIALGPEAAKTAVDSGALFLGRMKPCAYDDEPNVRLLVPELAGDGTSGAESSWPAESLRMLGIRQDNKQRGARLGQPHPTDLKRLGGLFVRVELTPTGQAK